MSGRAPYLFAFFLGAAIALLVYRFGVLPLSWDVPQAQLLTVVAVVLVFASWRLIRQTEPAQWPRTSMVTTALASFAAVMLIATFAVPSPVDSPLIARRLPGMTVSLPSGKEEKAELAYQSGEVMLSDVADSGGVIGVRWAPGKASDEKEATDLLVRGFEASVKKEDLRVEQWPGPGGAAKLVILIEREKGAMTLALLPCGERRVFLTALGNDNVRALLRRVLRSFVCQPDPAQEHAMSGLPWTLTLPEGWHADREDGGHFSNGESQLVVERSENPASADLVRVSMETLFGSNGAKVVVGPLKDDRFSLEITNESGKMLGWIRQLSCPQGSVTVYSLAVTEAARDAADQLVKDAGRCLAAGEAAPRWTVPEEAQEDAK